MRQAVAGSVWLRERPLPGLQDHASAAAPRRQSVAVRSAGRTSSSASPWPAASVRPTASCRAPGRSAWSRRSGPASHCGAGIALDRALIERPATDVRSASTAAEERTWALRYSQIDPPALPLFPARENSGCMTRSLAHAGKRSPNIGRPLSDSVLVASSWRTSQCSASFPSSTRTMSAAIHAAGRPWPEKRPCAIT